MKILLCDDHIVFAESLAHLLTTSGNEVVAVTHHPDNALAVLRTQAVDVSVLDVMFGPESVVPSLPEMHAAAPRTPIVLLSACIDTALVTSGRAAGVNGFAGKCTPASEIMRVIERVHAGDVVIPSSTTIAAAPPRAGSAPANAARRLAGYLTLREREVLCALVGGADTIRLARGLGITRATARCHVQSILMKLDAHSRLEAATMAVRFGLVDPEGKGWLL